MTYRHLPFDGSVREGDVCFAFTEQAMGAWRWGYPKGHRIALKSYKATILKNSKLVWKYEATINGGITASQRYLFEEYKDIPRFSPHNSLCNPCQTFNKLEKYSIQICKNCKEVLKPIHKRYIICPKFAEHVVLGDTRI